VPYIGNPPAEKYASYDVQHITTSATSSYVLDKNVANENEIRVVLNNIIQQPGSSYAYTASGNTLTLSAATTSSDTLYVVFTGKAVQTVTPPPSSVGLAQFNATGSPGTNTFLRGDNSWATPSDIDTDTVRPNAQAYIMNGNFDVWQRGTSFTTSVFTSDRWLQDLSGASATLTRETHTVGQTDVPDNPKYYLKQNVTTGNNNCGILQRIEDVDTLTGAFTLSFYAKGVNPNSGNLDIVLQQNFGSGGSTAVSLSAQDLTLTSSWQKFVFTGTLASLSGKTIGTSSYIQVLIKQPDDDSNTAAWNLQISQVQLESGTYTSSSIPPFQSETFGSNLQRCLRYFEKTYEIGVNPGTATGTGIIRSGGNQGGRTSGRMGDSTTYVVGKRAAPTVVFFDSAGNSGVMTRLDQGSSSSTNQNATLANGSSKSMEITSTGTSTADCMNYHFTADAEL